MAWTKETLQETLNRLMAYGSELPNLEVKKASEDYPQSIAETLCAFSNMPDGGTLICGVDETQNFTVVGVYDVDLLEKSITSTLRNFLSPKGNASFTRLEIGDATVLIADVAPLPLADRPCYYKGKAYMRYSDGDYAMDDYEVTRILAARERENTDTISVEGSSSADLDPVYLEKFLTAARNSSQRLSTVESETVLKRKSVLSASGNQATMAGLYALGNYPQQFFPSLKISGVVEGEGVRNADKLETDGPLPEMLQHAVQWLARNLRTTVVEDGAGGLKNKPEIPLIVLRELVANALVHRALDLETAQSKDVVIRVLPDKVIITNPGGLWAVTTKNIAEPGHKTAVNAALYEICKLAQTAEGTRVIEGEGNGVYEAQKAMHEAGLLPLEFIDKGFQFTVIIRRAPLAFQTGLPALEPENTEDTVFDSLLKTGEQTIAELEERTGLTRRQISYSLNKLVDLGRVSKRTVTGDRAKHYRVR